MSSSTIVALQARPTRFLSCPSHTDMIGFGYFSSTASGSKQRHCQPVKSGSTVVTHQLLNMITKMSILCDIDTVLSMSTIYTVSIYSQQSNNESYQYGPVLTDLLRQKQAKAHNKNQENNKPLLYKSRLYLMQTVSLNSSCCPILLIHSIIKTLCREMRFSKNLVHTPPRHNLTHEKSPND